ncbi:MAG: hypothetical protein WCR30_02935 [Clostridia bacterium]
MEENEEQIPEKDKSEFINQLDSQRPANGEQPDEEKNEVLAASAEENFLVTDSSSKDSSYGKFQTAEALVNAYNNLQSEFTKKCQKLSEMEKIKSDNAMEKEIKNSENDIPKAPQFEKEEWNTKVASFLSKNNDAKNYASQISEEIMKNPQKYSDENCLENAWATVASKNFVSAENLGKDEKFLNDYVYSSDEVKQKVLGVFLKEIEENKPPNLISSLSKGATSFASQTSAKTLQEAKAIVTNMFL